MIETSRLLRVHATVVQTGGGMAEQKHIASSIALNDATNGVRFAEPSLHQEWQSELQRQADIKTVSSVGGEEWNAI